MKIYEGEDDGIIGEFRYQTVEFTREELVTGGLTVISQGAVQRYFVAKNPDLAVKKFGSFKFDSQTNTVTARFAVATDYVGQDQKLLNPGYDELKEKCDKLHKANEVLLTELADIRLELSCPETTGMSLEPLYKWAATIVCAKLQLKEKYDALVIAVGKDAQKFSDLLVENEHLKEVAETRALEITRLTLAQQDIDLTPEDAVDLADAKEAIGSGSNVAFTQELVEKACDQAEVVGPDEGQGDKSV